MGVSPEDIPPGLGLHAAFASARTHLRASQYWGAVEKRRSYRDKEPCQSRQRWYLADLRLRRNAGGAGPLFAPAVASLSKEVHTHQAGPPPVRAVLGSFGAGRC